MDQVSEVSLASEREDLAGNSSVAAIIRRSAYVLSVAAVDSYFHERFTDLLRLHALRGAAEAGDVANYIQSVSASDVAGPIGEGLIRYRLSYRTLVAPVAIDKVLDLCGYDTQDVWLRVAITVGSRPDRLKRVTELVYDRRNMIAHESDWDSVQLDFRPMETSHLVECRNHVQTMVENFDTLL